MNKLLKNRKFFLACCAALGLFSIVSTTYFLNNMGKERIEQELNSFNGIKAPDNTALQGISVHFNPFKCSGVFSYKCSAEQVRFHAKGSGIDENILLASSITINSNDVKFDATNKKFKISVNELMPIDKLKALVKAKFEDPEIEKLNSVIFSQFFPMSVNVSADVVKNNGLINFSVDNKMIAINAMSLFTVNMLDKPFVVAVDKNGKLLQEGEDKQKLSAEYNTNQMYNITLKEMKIDVKNKELTEFLYNLYSLNMKLFDNNRRSMFNMYLFGLQSSEHLSLDKFKEQVSSALSEAIIDMPLPLFQTTLKNLKETFINKTDVTTHIENKTGIKIEEYSLILDYFKKDVFSKMEFTNDNFAIKGTK